MYQVRVKKLSFSPNKKDGASERGSLDQVDSGFNSMEFSNFTDPSCSIEASGSYQKLNKTPLKSRDENVVSTPNKKQQTSDYGSMHDVPMNYSSILKEKTPTKRRQLDNNENENSENYVSPPKIKAKENRARRTLREKCSSENAIPLSSTPIKNQKLRKFKSFHPEKFSRSIDIDKIEKDTIFEESPVADDAGPPKFQKFDESSINITNLDISHWDSTNFLENLPETPSGISALCSAPIKSLVHGKTILDQQKRRKFYDGERFVDIFHQLNKSQVLHALDKILGYLDSSNISSLHQTSRTCNKIVNENVDAKKRMLEFRRQELMCKENKDISKQEKDLLVKGQDKREPLEPLGVLDHNSFYQPNQSRYNLRSPPVSPKRRGFYENQKVIGDRKDVRIKKCPRCKASAPIVSMKLTPMKRRRQQSMRKPADHSMILRRSTFQQSIISNSSVLDKTALGFNDSRGSDSDKSRSNSSSPISDDYSFLDKVTDSEDEYEFAHCSKKSCDFKFCLKCLSRYHPRKKCKELSPASPNHTANSSIAGSKASKRSLKRLFK